MRQRLPRRNGLEIYLCRHGQDEDNARGILNGRRDTGLTTVGRKQAQTVATRILDSGLQFDSVYTSPLRRARKTADIISRIAHQPFASVENELVERNFGVMTGVSRDEIEERCSPHIIRTETAAYFLCPAGAETFPQLASAWLQLRGVPKQPLRDRRKLRCGRMVMFGVRFMVAPVVLTCATRRAGVGRR